MRICSAAALVQQQYLLYYQQGKYVGVTHWSILVQEPLERIYLLISWVNAKQKGRPWTNKLEEGMRPEPPRWAVLYGHLIGGHTLVPYFGARPGGVPLLSNLGWLSTYCWRVCILFLACSSIGTRLSTPFRYLFSPGWPSSVTFAGEHAPASFDHTPPLSFVNLRLTR